MNITVLAFQVQKRNADVGHYDKPGPWVHVARFPTNESAQSFVKQNASAYIGDPQRCELRVFCDPSDVARLMQAMTLAKGLKQTDWW